MLKSAVYWSASSPDQVTNLSCDLNVRCGELYWCKCEVPQVTRPPAAALLVPARVTLKAGASRVWAGYHATVVQDSNDKMFAWGLNNYGQLGMDIHYLLYYCFILLDNFMYLLVELTYKKILFITYKYKSS